MVLQHDSFRKRRNVSMIPDVQSKRTWGTGANCANSANFCAYDYKVLSFYLLWRICTRPWFLQSRLLIVCTLMQWLFWNALYSVKIAIISKNNKTVQLVNNAFSRKMYLSAKLIRPNHACWWHTDARDLSKNWCHITLNFLNYLNQHGG